MKIKTLFFLAIYLCACAAEEKEMTEESVGEQNKDKRQTQDEFVPSSFLYRTARKQEPVPPVQESQEEDDREEVSRVDTGEYRPGQVFDLNAQELLELQPERKSPLANPAQLQQLYPSPQEHRQNLQQIYYLEPGARQVKPATPSGLLLVLKPDRRWTLLTPEQLQRLYKPEKQEQANTETEQKREVSLQPSHAVIARPHYSSNGGEASVGAALSVSDSGASPSAAYPDPELLALLGQGPTSHRLDDHPAYHQQIQASTQSIAPQYQQVSTQSVAPQYQQVDRYITKPSKKPTKLRPKVHSQIAPPQASTAPQQYLIETTNIQQQTAPQQYRPAPQPQAQRAPQALRYVPIPTPQAYLQQALYERPESQGLKVVAPPKLQQQQPRQQFTYRVIPQYQQPEAQPKQYRLVEGPRPQPTRQEQRVPASSIERPVTYLKRFPEPEKMRSVKIYDPLPQEAGAQQQQQQIIGEQYYLRPLYRTNEPRNRYEMAQLGLRPIEQPRAGEPTKPPHSAIYVSQKVAPKKVARTQPTREPSLRVEQAASAEQVNIEPHGQTLEEQRSQLPPPKNNRAYTPEEFAALVAAGYSVTPVPVAPVGLQVAQSRSSLEAAPAPAPPPRRLYSSRRHQYLPLRGDDAP